MCPRDGSFVPGPTDPITNRGLDAVEYSAAASLAMRAATSLISKARSAMPYSASTIPNAPNVAVSTASTPASKYSRCMRAITSGRESTRCSLQPSSASPPKSSGPSSCACTHVPNAPSKIRTRSRRALRKSDIAPNRTGAPSAFCPLLSGDARSCEPIAPRHAHGLIGSRPQLAVARAVAVGPHVRGLFRQPCFESTRFLRATHVLAPEAPGEPAIRPDLELGREDGVEPETLGNRPDVHVERRAHEHQAVPLRTVPIDALHDVTSEAAPQDVEGERAAEAVEPLGVVSGEKPAHDLRLQRVAAPRSAAVECDGDASGGERLRDCGGAGGAAQERGEVVAGRQCAVEVEGRDDGRVAHRRVHGHGTLEGSDTRSARGRSVRSGCRTDRPRSSEGGPADHPPTAV